MTKRYIPWVAVLLAASLCAAGPVGIFEDHADVGTVLHAGSVEYDPPRRSYTVSGSGENMWSTADAFQFVWKKMSGDVTLTADISFVGTGGEAHRKAVLMIRQSLDADAAYADVAVHGSGLTSLQARDEKGAITSEIQSAVSGPRRVRIARRGAYFYIWVAGEGEEPHFAGGSMRILLADPIYVGLGVCAHNKDAMEKAVFSNVELSKGSSGQRTLYRTLEMIPVSGDRRVVNTEPVGPATNLELETHWKGWSPDGKKFAYSREVNHRRDIYVMGAGDEEATRLTNAGDFNDGAEYSPDGKYIYFYSDRGGTMQIWRMLPDGTAAEQVTAEDLQNGFPRLSPDGKQVAFLSYTRDVSGIPSNQDVMLRVMTLADSKVKTLARLVGGRETMDGLGWSPDGRRVSIFSYQLVP